MRVLLSTCGSRGDAGPMVRLAVQLRALGSEVPVCALPDFAELLAPVRRAAGAGRPAGAPAGDRGDAAVGSGLPRRAAELVAAQFDTVAAAADGCDALVATGLMPAGVWR